MDYVFERFADGLKFGDSILKVSNNGNISIRIGNVTPETMPVETKTHVIYNRGWITAGVYKDGNRVTESDIIPDIVDVTVKNNRALFVSFYDGTKEKVVLESVDEFSLEQGISICVAKKMMSMKSNGNGSSIYNKIIKRGLKVFAERQKEIEEEQIEEQKKKDRIAKYKAKKAKRAKAAKEAQIEMQKEAYLRAMREMNNISND